MFSICIHYKKKKNLFHLYTKVHVNTVIEEVPICKKAK